MKTILIFNDEPFFIPKIIEQIAALCPNQISAIYIIPPKMPRAYQMASMRLLTNRFLIQYLFFSIKSAFLKLIPIPVKGLKYNSIENICKAINIPCKKIQSVNTNDFRQMLRKEKIATVLSFSSEIYKKETLACARFFNFHPGLLPNNKGRFPIFWAIYNQDEHQGITCHEINEKIDDGRILFQQKIPYKKGDNTEMVLSQVALALPKIIKEALERIQKKDYQTILTSYPSFYGPTPNKIQIRHYHQVIKEAKYR